MSTPHYQGIFKLCRFLPGRWFPSDQGCSILVMLLPASVGGDGWGQQEGVLRALISIPQ